MRIMKVAAFPTSAGMLTSSFNIRHFPVTIKLCKCIASISKTGGRYGIESASMAVIHPCKGSHRQTHHPYKTGTYHENTINHSSSSITFDDSGSIWCYDLANYSDTFHNSLTYVCIFAHTGDDDD